MHFCCPTALFVRFFLFFLFNFPISDAYFSVVKIISRECLIMRFVWLVKRFIHLLIFQKELDKYEKSVEDHVRKVSQQLDEELANIVSRAHLQP